MVSSCNLTAILVDAPNTYWNFVPLLAVNGLDATASWLDGDGELMYCWAANIWDNTELVGVGLDDEQGDEAVECDWFVCPVIVVRKSGTEELCLC